MHIIEEIGRIDGKPIFRLIFDRDIFSIDETSFIEHNNGYLTCVTNIWIKKEALGEIEQIAPQIYGELVKQQQAHDCYTGMDCEIGRQIPYRKTDTPEKRIKKHAGTDKKLREEWMQVKEERLDSIRKLLWQRLVTAVTNHNNSVTWGYFNSIKAKVLELQEAFSQCFDGRLSSDNFSQICRDLDDIRERLYNSAYRTISDMRNKAWQ
jgi:hypothetical protein